MVTYVATLDVPRHVVDHLSRLPAARQRRIGTPRGSRALGPLRQAVLVLRWFRERACAHCLARDAGVSKAAAGGLPTPADKGYIDAGTGILIPVRPPKGRSEQALHTDTRTTNNLIRGVRALDERAAAELKQRRRTLQHVTLSPSRIGDIARAALVLNGICVRSSRIMQS
ncbi:transposase family protein [Streptomyces shenzhenensis]|uniref:transposase family protein n=1 Tax=Streptomyces shenzhenensis TaxID=943815 RepID=UPI0037F6E083